jgi:hypothetical protein
VERVNFHLTEGEIKGIKFISEITGVKKAEIIRRAVDEYISRKKWEGVTGLDNLSEVYA